MLRPDCREAIENLTNVGKCGVREGRESTAPREREREGGASSSPPLPNKSPFKATCFSHSKYYRLHFYHSFLSPSPFCYYGGRLGRKAYNIQPIDPGPAQLRGKSRFRRGRRGNTGGLDTAIDSPLYQPLPWQPAPARTEGCRGGVGGGVPVDAEVTRERWEGGVDDSGGWWGRAGGEGAGLPGLFSGSQQQQPAPL